MNTAQPIRDLAELEQFKNYYKEIKPNLRNHLLIVLGLNAALRISDILQLQWKDVYDFHQKRYQSHIRITEQKTGKTSQIYVNQNVHAALKEYRQAIQQKGQTVFPEEYLFSHSNKNIPITRVQAFRIIKSAAKYCNLSGVISCHSLRKTFGYHAWKQGAEPALLMNIYNHSTYQVTKRYLGIEQDDRDRIFQSVCL